MTTKILPSSSSAYEYPLLIKRILTSNQRFEQHNGIVHRNNRFSYKEFNERVCRLANALKAMGVKEGDTVGVLDWDSNRYLECYFAIPMIGAVLHTVNIRLSSDQILYTVNHAEDDILFIHEDFLSIVESISDQFTTVKKNILLSDRGDGVQTSLEIAGEYETLLAENKPSYEFPDFDENSVATLFYTTGTTGNPKGVYFSHRQLVLHTLHLVNTLSHCASKPLMHSDGAYMPVTPMFHVHAWGMPYAATMLGIQQVYPGKYEPNVLAKLIREEGVTFSHCVPTVLQMILDSQEAKNTDFSNWSVVIGGSQLTAGLAKKAIDAGAQPLTGYGMSETCPVMALTKIGSDISSLSAYDQIPYRVKAGLPTILVDIEIWGPNGEPLPHDGESTGEVVVRSPWLTQNYYKEDQKGEELWSGGWLHTGDIASIHSNGYVEIRDRIKDVIKTGGEWISSLELEDLISQHPMVESVAVIGVPDDRWGERPHSIVVSNNEELDAKLIKLHLEQFVETGQINKWAIPASIDFVEEIPKTSVGKIDKKRIRAGLL
ncbi:MAG: fatty acid--CoA ligase [Neptuniibacter sp.]